MSEKQAIKEVSDIMDINCSAQKVNYKNSTRLNIEEIEQIKKLYYNNDKSLDS